MNNNENHASNSSVIQGLSAYTGGFTNLAHLAAGAAIPPGTAVHVTGTAPSHAPGDRTATFKPDNGDPVVNTFTVASVYTVGDFDKCGGASSPDLETALGPPPGVLSLAAGEPPRAVRLYDFTSLPGDYTLTLTGAPGTLLVRPTASTNGYPLLTIGQTVTNGNPVTFTSTGKVYVQPLAPGTATLTLAFQGTGTASNYNLSATLPITVYGVKCQPVTAETAQGGTAIVNPAVVGLGWLARYTIDVLPSSFPDSDIVWSIAQGTGNVVFIGGNTGRSVVVRGNAEGDFKLEVTIGNPIAPLSPKPYILGKVLTETVTALHFFIIYDAAGNPSVTETEIDLWIDELNRIFRQVAMRFVKGSVTPIKNKPEWFIMSTSAPALTSLYSYTNNVGGLKVYCVHRFTTPTILGLTRCTIPTMPSDGIAIAENAKPNTLAHEIGHACGLDDIFLDDVGYELVSEALLGSANWSGGTGTGYYPSGLLHRNLIQRLLMYGYQDGTEADIPLADLNEPRMTIGTARYRIPVGLEIMNRTPWH